MALTKREEAAAVVQHDPGVARDDAGAEALVDRLNERDDVAVAIRGGEVDSVAAGFRMVFLGIADPRDRQRLVFACGAIGVDLPAPIGGVLLGQHSLQRGGRHRVGVREPRVAIGERDPLRLDQQVQIRRGIVSERLQVVSLENVQHLQR